MKNKRTKVGSLYSFKIDLNLINEILVKVTFVERVEVLEVLNCRAELITSRRLAA